MSGLLGGDFGRRVVEQLKQVAKDRGQRVAEQWGEPIRGESLTREQQAQLWNMQSPQIDAAQVQQLIAAGQHGQALDLVYPWRRTLIGQGNLQARIDRAQSLADNAASFQAEGNVGASS